MLLIVGASGAVGKPLIKQLLGRGVSIKVLTSSEVSQANLKQLGVKNTFLGDFRSDIDVTEAMHNSSSVCYIPARFQEDEFEIGKRVVDGAAEAKVEHFCFCSAYHPQVSLLGHHWQKLKIEEYLIESDLMYSVVQPSMFMQNIRVEWPKIVAEGIYARPYSIESRMNVIDTNDLAEALVNIITNRKFWGATYELCGSILSHKEMARIIETELGKPIKAMKRDIADWKAWAIDRNWSKYAIEQYVRMCNHYDKHGYKFGNDTILRAIIGRRATDYRTFIRRFIKEH